MLFQKIADTYHEFVIERDKNSCIGCSVCVRQCSYGVHYRDDVRDIIVHDNGKCVGCHRCAALCPTGALAIKYNDNSFGRNGFKQAGFLRDIYTQAETGKKIVRSNHNYLDVPVYWDKLFLDIRSNYNDSNSGSGSNSDIIKFDVNPSIPINPNLYLAMKMASDKLGMAELIYEQDGDKLARIVASSNVADRALEAVNGGVSVLVIEAGQTGFGVFSAVGLDGRIPIEFAIAKVDQILRDENVRDDVSIVAASGIRCSFDAVKAIALGADAVCIGTATMVAVGCSLCGSCNTGKCPWGIATTNSNLCKRQNPEVAAEKMANLVNSWNLEILDVLSEMGLISVINLRGKRNILRAVGLSETEMKILGVTHAGQ